MDDRIPLPVAGDEAEGPEEGLSSSVTERASRLSDAPVMAVPRE